jgi:hypothetical protein
MEDRTYFLTLAVIFVLAGADVLFRSGQDLLFLVREVLDLMDYLIFWR